VEVPDNHNNPLVSVVLCTYNGGKYIAEQLLSIVKQTYNNIELIIVDDASTDQTGEIISNFQQTDSRIKLFINDTNIGYNKNFEKAIGLASADYIAISDQDDIWEENKIEIMMSNWPAMALFVFSLSGNFWGEDFANRKTAPTIYYADIADIHKLVFNSPVHGHACMFKKELISHCLPFPTDIFYDWWISMHAASIGTIGCIPHTLTWHRVHDSNSSRTLTSIADEEEKNKQLRNQCAYFIETFCEKPIAREKEKRSLLQYASLLRKMDGKKFSAEMFRYIVKNRRLVFHYKKKPFALISHIKHAWRMAYKGLL
jgi:glycosyltransferase involved in cell wall biosynthesis